MSLKRVTVTAGSRMHSKPLWSDLEDSGALSPLKFFRICYQRFQI